MNRQDIIEALNQREDQLYFSIGTVSDLINESPSTIRYWEQQVDSLEPSTTDGGQRRYRHEDVELIADIKYLVRQQQLTVQGASNRIDNEANKFPGEREVFQSITQLCDQGLAEIRDCFEQTRD